jgi:CRISPR-associated protein Csx16
MCHYKPKPSTMGTPTHGGGDSQQRTIFLTRHPGALHWLRDKIGCDSHVEVLEHLDDVLLKCHDRIYGIFPMHIAARLCAAGVECWMIDVAIPPELRGVEMTSEQLNQLGAQLIRYHVRRIGGGPCGK